MKRKREVDLLERLEPVLAAESLEEALERGAETAAALVGARAAGLFLHEAADVAHEGWWPRRVDSAMRAKLRRHARGLAGRETTPEDEPAFESFAMRSGGQTLGTLCCAGLPGRLDKATGHQLERALAVIAARCAAHVETERAQALRTHYERWFRTLDEQLRVLDRERQKFSAVVHSSDAMVFVADAEGVVSWTNAVLAAIDPPEPRPSGWVGVGCGSVCEHFGPEGGGGCGDCPVRRAMATNLVTHHELSRPGPGGARDHYFTAMPIKGPDGSPHEVMVMIQDVTGLEPVRRAEQNLRTVITHVPIVLFSVDRNGVFTMSEGLGLGALGIEPGSLVGCSAFDVYEDNAQIVTNLKRALAGDSFTDTVTVGPLTFETRYTAVRDARDEVAGVIGVAMDVSERRLLEERLRQAQKMEAIGRLAGGVAHDFNNLLAAILGHAEMLLDRLDHEHPVRHGLEEVQRAGQRGAVLTRQLLAFSRKGVVTPEGLDVNVVVAEMDDLLRRLIGEDIELATRFVAPNAWVRMDRGQLEQVLMNLAVNARDALPAGGQIALDVDVRQVDPADGGPPGLAAGSYVRIAVIDDGCGMDSDVRAHVFEPFFTTKSAGKGTGLGLSTVYAIVQSAGGHIGFDSEPGLGTTFEIFFPESEAPPAGAAPEPVCLETRGGDESILLVEDDDSVRSLVRDALSLHGYRVLEARDGADAIWRMRQEGSTFDLLITDVVMPQMGGGELAQRLQTIRPGLRVLFMSGYPDDAVVRQGVVEEGAPFIQKPFMLEALARKVREVLDGAPRSGAPRESADPDPRAAA